MKTLFVGIIALLVTLAATFAAAARPRGHALTKEYTYERYVRDHGKTDRTPEEHALRRRLYERELEVVLAHNSQQPAPSYTKGVNQFSDWTEEEKATLFTKNYHGIKRYQKTKPVRIHKPRDGTTAASLPYEIDYRGRWPRVLTDIKDQGQCGSCWAHAATETIESAWAIATGDLFTLSQQTIASCTSNPDDCGGNGGCGGGIAELAINSIAARGGIGEEWSTPYQSYWGNNFDCKGLGIWKNLTKVQVTGYTAIQTNDVGAALRALTERPIAIGMDASQLSSYDSGVYAGCSYNRPDGRPGNQTHPSETSIDHAILAVGYGKDDSTGKAYLIVRNSWSANWGVDGYFYLQLDIPGEAAVKCGWARDPQNGNGCKGQTAPYYTCGMCAWAYDTLFANADYIR